MKTLNGDGDDDVVTDIVRCVCALHDSVLSLQHSDDSLLTL